MEEEKELRIKNVNCEYEHYNKGGRGVCVHMCAHTLLKLKELR